MNRKYELTDNTKTTESGIVLHQIMALKSFRHAEKGDLGGWIEEESNLSQSGDAWVLGDARVCGGAQVYGDAQIYGGAWVLEDARVHGDARVYGGALVHGDARVYGGAWVHGGAQVSGDAHVYGGAHVLGDARVCGGAQVYGDARVCGGAQAYGDARVYGGALVHGGARVCGEIFATNTREYHITLCKNWLTVGCQSHDYEKFIAFSDREILEMDGKGALEWWFKWRPIIEGAHAAMFDD